MLKTGMARCALAGTVAVAGVAVLSACSTTPPAEEPARTGPIDPLDAFEQVGEPEREYTGVGRGDPDNLSSDIERLQDARREYQSEKARESAEVKRNQAQCNASKDSRKVPIDDGNPEPGVFCQK